MYYQEAYYTDRIEEKDNAGPGALASFFYEYMKQGGALLQIIKVYRR